MTSRVRRPAVALVCAVCAAACAAKAVHTEAPAGLAWPTGEPRIALERVIVTRRSGAAVLSWLTGERDLPLFERPYGVAWLGDDLVVADPAARRLVRIGADGTVAQSRPDPQFAPLGLASCGGELIASDSESGRVARFDRALRRVGWLASGLERPTGLACEGETAWVVETTAHRVTRLGRDGSRRSFGGRGTGDGEFNFPVALALKKDALLVGDTLNFRIQEIDPPSGRFRSAFGRLGDSSGDMPRLKGLAVDSEGHVWASDAHLDEVSIYTPGGQLLLSLGRTGSAAGEFSFPAGLAAHPDGRVAVADALNRRVQVFRLLPGGRARR